MICVGIDGSEQHHDGDLLDDDGEGLARCRVPDGLDGVGRLHALLADHAEDAGEVASASRPTAGCW